MFICKKCKKNAAAEVIGLCVQCIRNIPDKEQLHQIHSPIRKTFNLPVAPPEKSDGVECNLCANQCHMSDGDIGFCGLHWNKSERICHRVPKDTALVSIYHDPLPTNCCAGWFCTGNKKTGNNLAVFFYGCNFNCLYCQNSSHKYLEHASILTEDQLVNAVLDPNVRCICFFGGSPEPQLPFTIRLANKIIEQSLEEEWKGLFELKQDTNKPAAKPNAFLAACEREENERIQREFRDSE